MTRPASLRIVGMGAATAVGRSAHATAAAIRAGVSGSVEHPYIVDSMGEPVRVAMAPWLDPDLPIEMRFEGLLRPAVEQALAPVLEIANGRMRIGIALALPSSRPGLPPTLEGEMRDALARAYGDRVSRVASFPSGHAAGLVALDAACLKIGQGELDACVVVAVESYIEPDTLEWLDESSQLHGAGELNNAWGFIPGEAAAAVTVGSAALAEEIGVTDDTRILSVATSQEPNRIKTQTVCLGEGLTRAFRTSLAALPDGMKVTDIYCDMNGEPYRADEFGFACLRTRESFVGASEFVAPADCCGDVSAAAGPLGVILASIACSKGYAKGPHALVWASSEGGERAAALVQAPVLLRE